MNLGSLVVRAVLVSCGAVLVLCGSGSPAAADTADDTHLVFCLSRPQREALVDAATALGLARPGRMGDRLMVDDAELDAAAWRATRPEDFDRACRALFEGQRPPGASVFTTVFPLIAAVAGAAVAFGATTWRDRVSRGNLLADDLRGAARGFEREAEAYIRSWSATRPADTLLERRAELQTQLARARAAHRTWTAIPELEARLSAGPLGATLTTGWTGRQEARRKDELIAELGRMRTDIHRVAHALQTPMRPRRGLRTEPVARS